MPECQLRSIGEAGTPGARRKWINAECEIAIKHLKRVCGKPPPEMELEVQWQDHDHWHLSAGRARLASRLLQSMVSTAPEERGQISRRILKAPLIDGNTTM